MYLLIWRNYQFKEKTKILIYTMYRQAVKSKKDSDSKGKRDLNYVINLGLHVQFQHHCSTHLNNWQITMCKCLTEINKNDENRN